MSDITDVSLSEDGSFISFAFQYGYSVYSMYPVSRKLKKDFVNFKISSISISPDGTRTALGMNSAHGTDKTPKVFIWNNFYGESEAELDFKEPIQALCIRQNILIVILSNSVCLYDLKESEMMFEQVTAANERGAGDISFDETTPKLAICGLIPGSIQIISLKNETRRPVLVQAHIHTISMIKFSRDASLVATVSDFGTLIRVFESSSGSLRCVFRRGSLKSRIHAMAFSPDNKLIAVLSESGTLHLFDMTNTTKEDEKAPRASDKLKISKTARAEMVFLATDHLCIVISCGVIHNIRVKNKTLALTNSILALAH